MKKLLFSTMLLATLAGCKININVSEGGDIRLPDGSLCKSNTVCAVDVANDGAWIYPRNIQTGFYIAGYNGCKETGGTECFVVPSASAVTKVDVDFRRDVSIHQSGLSAAILQACYSNRTRLTGTEMVSKITDLECDGKIGDSQLQEIANILPMLETFALNTGDVTTISNLQKLRHLTTLTLSHNAMLSDITIINNLAGMQNLTLLDNPKIPCGALDDLKRALPKITLQVDTCQATK